MQIGIYYGFIFIFAVVAKNFQGKSQLAYQLLLQVQLPVEYGGLNGAAAHISIGNILSQYVIAKNNS